MLILIASLLVVLFVLVRLIWQGKGMTTVQTSLMLLPWVSVVTILLLAAMAWAQLGHWPYYSHPDPQDVAIAGFEIGRYILLVAWVSLFASVLAVAGVAGSCLYVLLKRRPAYDAPTKRHVLGSAARYALGLVCLTAVLRWNFSWLAD